MDSHRPNKAVERAREFRDQVERSVAERRERKMRRVLYKRGLRDRRGFPPDKTPA